MCWLEVGGGPRLELGLLVKVVLDGRRGGHWRGRVALLDRDVSMLLLTSSLSRHFSILLLLYMDGSQSTIGNVDSGNWGRLSSHCKFALVLFGQNPRCLHAHKLAFLESTPLASFSCFFVDFAILCPGAVQNWTVTVHCSPEKCPAAVASNAPVVKMLRSLVSTNAAAGSFENVVALPWLLNLPPGVAVVHTPCVTHREHQTEQIWCLCQTQLRSRYKFSRPPSLPLSLSYSFTPLH